MLVKTIVAMILLSIFSYSKDITVPKSFNRDLCKELNFGRGCSYKNNSLVLSNVFKMDNEKLLLFFAINKAHAMYQEGFINIPVVIDKSGKWTISKDRLRPVFGDIQRDSKGGLWVETNIITGDYSSHLYYSKDGLSWDAINIDYRDSYDICMLPNDLQLIMDNTLYALKTSYIDALNKNPHWQSLDKKTYKKNKCLKFDVKNNHWSIKSVKSTIQFSNSKSSVNVLLNMNDLRGKYTIQLGTFKNLKNIDREWLQIHVGTNEYYEVIIKKMKVNNRVIYKVFLDTFFEKSFAEKTLNEIKFYHPSNLKKAFVTELPKECIIRGDRDGCD